MLWNLIVDPAVKKQLKRIPREYAGRIILAIQQFAVNPYGGDIEKMQGEKDVWRRRIGSYRIYYEIRAARKDIYVFDVLRRTSRTY